MELKYRKYKFQRRDGSEGRGNNEKEIEKLKENPYYLNYWNQKQEIVNRYPKVADMTITEYRQYLKEIGDLMWSPDGWFQQYIWDNIDEWTQVLMDRKARGKQPRNHHWDEEFGGWVKDEE